MEKIIESNRQLLIKLSEKYEKTQNRIYEYSLEDLEKSILENYKPNLEVDVKDIIDEAYKPDLEKLGLGKVTKNYLKYKKNTEKKIE